MAKTETSKTVEGQTVILPETGTADLSDKGKSFAMPEVGEKKAEPIELEVGTFVPGRDVGTYTAEREDDEFRGNENNRRVMARRAAKGDVGLAPDPAAVKRYAPVGGLESVVLGDNSAGPSPNAPATLTENPAGTTADPQGLTARAGNGGGAGGFGGWNSNV